MCGIVGGLNVEFKAVIRGLRAVVHRGPDAQRVTAVGDATFGHARLAILDPDPRSNQPFLMRGKMLAFNGEIWNFRALRAKLEALGRSFSTDGDTEVLAAALDEWGDAAVERLEWMGALAWTDGKTIMLARDPFGEIPLHVAGRFFASELKGLIAMGCDAPSAVDVAPGEILFLSRSGTSHSRRYYLPPIAPRPTDLPTAAARLRDLVLDGCRERAISDVPVCALLSGGIDSAAICLGLSRIVPNLVAYAAVFDERSPDLRAARKVAEFLKIELREVKVPLPTRSELCAMIEAIEIPHKAQVEIAWPCSRLAARMRGDGFRVTFSGEGADELFASYGFSFHALKNRNWHEYRRELVLTQARKNFNRVNKIFMLHGIEARLPFLHRPLVEYVLSLPREAVQAKSRPKAVMQEAFRGLLPDAVVGRAKLAFQDGMKIKTAIEAVADRAFYLMCWADRYGTSRAQAELFR